MLPINRTFNVAVVSWVLLRFLRALRLAKVSICMFPLNVCVISIVGVRVLLEVASR